MAKNQTGKAFGMQGGPASGERTAEKMTYEKVRMEIVYFPNEDVFATGIVAPSITPGFVVTSVGSEGCK